MAGAIAIVSFFILQNVLTILFDEVIGPVKCRDGYASSSIGRSGACRSHGGVDRSRDALIAVLSVAGAGAIFIWCAPIGRAPQIERPSCDPGSNTIGGQIDMKQRSGRGCWARLVAALGTLPLEALRLD